MAVNCVAWLTIRTVGKKEKTNDQNKRIVAPRDYHRFDKKNTFRTSVMAHIYDTSRRKRKDKRDR